MSELSYIVGHTAGVTEICSVWGKLNTHLVTRGVKCYECGCGVRVKEIHKREDQVVFSLTITGRRQTIKQTIFIQTWLDSRSSVA